MSTTLDEPHCTRPKWKKTLTILCISFSVVVCGILLVDYAVRLTRRQKPLTTITTAPDFSAGLDGVVEPFDSALPTTEPIDSALPTLEPIDSALPTIEPIDSALAIHSPDEVVPDTELVLYTSPVHDEGVLVTTIPDTRLVIHAVLEAQVVRLQAAHTYLDSVVGTHTVTVVGSSILSQVLYLDIQTVSSKLKFQDVTVQLLHSATVFERGVECYNSVMNSTDTVVTILDKCILKRSIIDVPMTTLRGSVVVTASSMIYSDVLIQVGSTAPVLENSTFKNGCTIQQHGRVFRVNIKGCLFVGSLDITGMTLCGGTLIESSRFRLPVRIVVSETLEQCVIAICRFDQSLGMVGDNISTINVTQCTVDRLQIAAESEMRSIYIDRNTIETCSVRARSIAETFVSNNIFGQCAINATACIERSFVTHNVGHIETQHMDESCVCTENIDRTGGA